MKQIEKITEKELLIRVADGVSKNVIWTKPMLLLTKDDDDNIYMNDTLNEIYENVYCINGDPHYKVEVVNGKPVGLRKREEKIVVRHRPEIELYKYLGGCLGYDEDHHRYCVELCKYESKPVISFICVLSKLCSIDCIPEWMYDEFEILMLERDLEIIKEKFEKYKSNILFFENDAEFIDFCISIVNKSDKVTPYYDGELSEMYLKAIGEGKKFVIKDKESKVFDQVLAEGVLNGEFYVSDKPCHVHLDLDFNNFIFYFDYKFEEGKYLRKIKELEE